MRIASALSMPLFAAVRRHLLRRSCKSKIDKK
jgi:hypothetical protein